MSLPRLDLYISSHLNLSRSKAQALIRSGQVKVENKSVKSGFLVSGDSHISYSAEPTDIEDETPLQAPTPFTFSHDFLYEDKDILVINKPIGLVVHPGSATHEKTLVDYISDYSDNLSITGGENRPGIVHRLDKDTEGLMVIAKSELAYESLHEQFKNREVKKTYLAMVSGNISDEEMEVNVPIGRHTKHRHKMAKNDDVGKEANTSLTVLKRYITKTFVKLVPSTGRTHQLRVHMAHIGHPILGDPLYGKKRYPNRTQQLQAVGLSFRHPSANIVMAFSLPPSKRLGV